MKVERTTTKLHCDPLFEERTLAALNHFSINVPLLKTAIQFRHFLITKAADFNKYFTVKENSELFEVYQKRVPNEPLLFKKVVLVISIEDNTATCIRDHNEAIIEARAERRCKFRD